MELKELRKTYGYSLELLQNAMKRFQYQKGSFEECLEQAINWYSDYKKSNLTRYVVYGTAQKDNRVVIVELKTQTHCTATSADFLKDANALAKDVLLKRENLLKTQNLLIAKYGENIEFGEIRTIDITKGYVKLLNHRGRFVVIYSYFTGKETNKSLPKKTKIIAQNILRYHTNYLGKNQKNRTFKNFLGLQPVFGLKSYQPEIFGRYLTLLPEVSLNKIYVYGPYGTIEPTN